MAIGSTNASTGSVAPTTGDYLVRYIDIDGTVLKEQYVNSGQNATPPSNPNIDSTYLTFNQWNKSSTNITNHKDIGALYTTLNNKTYAFITLTTASGVAPTLYFNKSDGSTLTVDWGDSTQSTFKNSGNFNTGAHTYSTTGNYIISIWISSGSGTYSFGNGGSGSPFLGTYKSTLTKIYIGSKVTTLQAYSFFDHRSLQIISSPITLTTLAVNSFNQCYSLKGYNCNDNNTTLPTSVFRYLYNAVNISLPSTVSSIGGSCLGYLYNVRYLVLPVISDNTLSSKSLEYARGLKTLQLNSSILNISDYALTELNNLENLALPTGFLTYGVNNSYLTSLKSIDFPSSTTSIGNFSNCIVLIKIICRATTPPTLASGAFSTSNQLLKIYVPDANVAAYKAATNWSTYANYIYGISTM